MRTSQPTSSLVSAPKRLSSVFLNEKTIPKENSVKYLVVYLDKRLTWAIHIKIKRKSLSLKLPKFRHFLRSNISLENKLFTYKQIIHPAMTYSIQLKGATKISNLNIFQSFQSINLRLITKAPWYVSNLTLYTMTLTFALYQLLPTFIIIQTSTHTQPP